MNNIQISSQQFCILMYIRSNTVINFREIFQNTCHDKPYKSQPSDLGTCKWILYQYVHVIVDQANNSPLALIHLLIVRLKYKTVQIIFI